MRASEESVTARRIGLLERSAGAVRRRQPPPGRGGHREIGARCLVFEVAKSGDRPRTGLAWSEMKLKEVGTREHQEGPHLEAEFGSFTQDPGNPQAVYGGAWSSSEPGFAVSKSVDGGKSWKPAAAGLPGPGRPAAAGFQLLPPSTDLETAKPGSLELQAPP